MTEEVSMARIKWGEKKCQGHVKYAKVRKPWKRSVEKKTRQAAKRALRREEY